MQLNFSKHFIKEGAILTILILYKISVHLLSEWSLIPSNN